MKMQRNKGNLLLGAAVVGGLYWASKQPGGIPGVWNRFSDKVKQVSDSPDPLGTLKAQINEARFKNAPAGDNHAMEFDNAAMTPTSYADNDMLAADALRPGSAVA